MTETFFTMQRYIDNLITDHSLKEKIVSSTGAEGLYNPTYAEVAQIFFEEGILFSIVPGFTMVTPDNLNWTAEVFQWDGKSGYTLKRHPMVDSYKTWEEAANAAVEKCCSILDEKNYEIENRSQNAEQDRSVRETIERTRRADNPHAMDHPLYGRHSDEDPLIYE